MSTEAADKIKEVATLYYARCDFDIAIGKFQAAAEQYFQ